jgi:hypothetical protein
LTQSYRAKLHAFIGSQWRSKIPQDLCHFYVVSISSKGFRRGITSMSEMPLRKYRSPEICKIMTISLIAAISDPTIHGIWLPLGQFIEHLCTKYPNGDGIQFVTKELVKQPVRPM